MKWLLSIAGTATGVYYFGTSNTNPEIIENPMYVESPVDIKIPEIGRELEYVLVGEMMSQEDCRDRSERYVKRLLAECRECTFTKLQRRSDLEKCYKKLFHGQTTYTTFLSLDRGNRFERDRQVVIWGLNDLEAEYTCNHVGKEIEKKYEGFVTCMAGRLS